MNDQAGIVRVETLAMIVFGVLAGYLVLQLALWVGRTMEAGAQAVG